MYLSINLAAIKLLKAVYHEKNMNYNKTVKKRDCTQWETFLILIS